MRGPRRPSSSGNGAKIFLLGQRQHIFQFFLVAVSVEKLRRLERRMVNQIGDDVVSHVAADVVVMMLGNGEVLDQTFLFQSVEGADDSQVRLGLVHRMVAERKL